MKHRQVAADWAAAAALAAASAATAHNSWLVASPSQAPVGGEVRLAFVTAHETFPKSESAVDPARIAAGALIGPGGSRAVGPFAVEGAETAARVRLDEPGVHVTAVALQPKFIRLEAPDFEEYLREEGAEEALRARAERGEAGEAGRESYTKFAKAFVRAGEGGAGEGWLARAGHALEIVPLADPCGLRAGDSLDVLLLLDGAPAPGRPVSSGHESRGGHVYVETVRTDGVGRARLTLGEPGAWFVRAHVMRAAGPDAPAGEGGERANWESLWATVTLRVEERAP